jgi:hypothetical protein
MQTYLINVGGLSAVLVVLVLQNTLGHLLGRMCGMWRRRFLIGYTEGLLLRVGSIPQIDLELGTTLVK